MILLVKASLQDYVTGEYAKKLGEAVIEQLKDGIGNLSAVPIDEIRVNVEDVDGNNLWV